jgi:hypothetical protein
MWLQSTPPEGQVLTVALITALASIYGTETYLEFHNEDLIRVNHTGPHSQNYTDIKKLKTLGIIDVAKGVDGKTTMRLAESRVAGLDRRTLYSETIGYDLSLEGTLIWTYLLGRLANVDENTEITTINKVREYEHSEKLQKYRGKEKTSTTHIIPQIYRDRLGLLFTDLKDVEPIANKPSQELTLKQKARLYYEAKRLEILEQKRLKYNGIKPAEDETNPTD